MSDSKNSKIFLIDTFAFIFRAYYANKNLKNGATFTFSKILLQIIKTYQPEYIACVFDTPTPTFRHKLSGAYKANREEMPEDLVPQIPMIREILQNLSIPMVQFEGYEADDVLATLAEKGCNANLRSVIVSPDKDLLQLVRNDDIQVLNIRDGEIWYDREGVHNRMGVYPEQIVDFLTLVGDASDNIQGVPGIGEKGAAHLLEKYGTLDNIIYHIDELKPRQQNGLKESETWRSLSKQLVTLVKDLSLPLKIEDLKYQGISHDNARDVFLRFGFHSLAKEFTLSSEIKTTSATRKYEQVRSLAQLKEIVEQCRGVGYFSLDTETTSIDATRGHLVGLSLAWKDNHGVYIPLGHLKLSKIPLEGILPGLLPESGLSDNDLDLQGEASAYYEKIYCYLDENNLPFAETREILNILFADSSIKKCGQNLKYDLQVLERHGFHLEGIDDDSMLLSYILESNLRHNLDDLSVRHLGLKPISFEEVVGKGRTQKRFDEIQIEKATQYAAEDADLARRLCLILKKQLINTDQLRIYRQIDLPLMRVLADIETTGIALDIEVLKNLSEKFTQERNICEENAIKLAGKPFNLNSPTQLGKVLFEELKLPVIRYTGKSKSPSTDEETLFELAQKHNSDFARILLRHRELQKMLGTYIDALPKMINPITNRIHTRLHQAAVASGRLASSDPNLQNIPVRTEEGKSIRKAFISRPGWCLIDADYSQIELRVVAALAEDPVLLDAFKRGEDIHRRTASEVMGIPLDKVSNEDRSKAKAVNFGLLYGQGAFALAGSLGITHKEAKDFIDRYFERMPRVADWIEQTKKAAEKEGQATTYWGRTRRIPDLESTNGNIRSGGLRVAVNTVVQGTAADIMRRAMVKFNHALRGGGYSAKILLQVHDELLIEAPQEEYEDVSKLLKYSMEHADDIQAIKVPLVVEIRKGSNWLECK
ncbi:MAG: DNA polymerase I [Holophagaceae bacterium]|jgi:DNA polymerase-1